ncbi:energy-coupling factor transporter ATPase [Clostridium sp. NSJ-6]|uniref:Energy-coupling factor transporter ATP-binding protein EcfA2 n=1 Tax=Clostridium hominis TaxID=2763036 RepID=A0ABR7DJS0_9CLOT|nr:energy-coupling factor transporter ATPase [Clostridium hominis]MBC5630908.1 energy-coupling factor transporter ATPase [Clostridium hominis]MDU2673760.1 energy-coupling factor transporter ATPase [Clostridium sp.]
MSIKIENLTHIYMPKTPFEKKALDDVNLYIEDGEFIALIGHTGSGKSTLIQHLNGLLEPSSGKIIVDDIDITEKGVKLSDIRKKVGLVFQYPEYQLFEETIEKDIAFGPTNLGLGQEEILVRVKRAMEMVGLDYDKYKDVSPFELSGGQKRRVAIAGVIAMEPKVLILDEPTAGLDPKGREDILAQIKKLHDEYKMTIILVSHSMEDVGKLAKRIVVMNHGKVALQGEPKDVFKEIDTLEEIGLGVPQVTYLMRELKRRGFNVSDEVFTVEQGKEELLKIFVNDKKSNMGEK